VDSFQGYLYCIVGRVLKRSYRCQILNYRPISLAKLMCPLENKEQGLLYLKQQFYLIGLFRLIANSLQNRISLLLCRC
jgi:hypothetical protein